MQASSIFSFVGSLAVPWVELRTQCEGLLQVLDEDAHLTGQKAAGGANRVDIVFAMQTSARWPLLV
jgi:hypothetical protein